MFYKKHINRKANLFIFLASAMLAAMLSGCAAQTDDLSSASGSAVSEGGETAFATAVEKDVENTYGNTTGNIVNGGLVAQQGGWTYYNGVTYSHGGIGNRGLKKSLADGMETESILSFGLTGGDVSINVIGEWIYLGNCYPAPVYSDRSGSLRKIRTDGTEETELIRDDCEYVNVVDGWIYYCKVYLSHGNPYHANATRTNVLCKIRTDGTEATQMTGGECNYLNVAAGWIYFPMHLFLSGYHSILWIEY